MRVWHFLFGHPKNMFRNMFVDSAELEVCRCGYWVYKDEFEHGANLSGIFRSYDKDHKH